MKILKKVLLIVVALMLVASMFFGCGEEELTDDTIKATPKPTPENLISQIKLSGYVYFDGAKNLENYYLSFNKKYPGVEVTIHRDDVGSDLYFEAVDNIIENGNYDELGDVVLLDSSRMAKLAEKGVLVNLSSYVGEVLNYDTYSAINPSKDLLPAAYKASLYNDQLYMVAIEYNHNFVFLNVSMLEKYGYDFPKDDWTWDDIVAIAKDIKTQGVATPIAMDYTEYSVWGSFARSEGQEIYDYVGNSTDTKELCLTNPKVVRGIETLAEIVDPSVGIVDCVDASDIAVEDLSKYAFIVANHEDITRWEDTICSEECDFEWDYIHFPRWNAEDYETTGNYYQSIGTEVYGFAVINHGESETYNDEFYTSCAYLALQATVTSTSKSYCLDGEAVPACKEANTFKFWREYPVEGKNSSVFSNFAETADFADNLSCFMPIMSENEIDIDIAVETYIKSGYDEVKLIECLQKLQDYAIASWIN